jgi:D-serine dehydratase
MASASIALDPALRNGDNHGKPTYLHNPKLFDCLAPAAGGQCGGVCVCVYPGGLHAMRDVADIIGPISELTKGLPPSSPALDVAAVAGKGWNLLGGDLPLPVAVLHKSALERNEAWMRAFRERSGILMAPHGKTTMSPQLFARQLDAGCWAITVATVHQLRVCRRFGIERVVLANQLMGRAEIDYVFSELARDREFEFFCLVDSVAGVELLDQGARRNPPGRALNVLVEGGIAGGRTGCRTVEEAVEVAQAVHASSPHLALRGVEGFEGLDAKASDEAIASFIGHLVQIAEACDGKNLFSDDGPVLLSAGGSAYFDIVVDVFSRARLSRPTQIVTRSGCYITMDSAMYVRAFERLFGRSPQLGELGPAPQAAIEVWAYVQSRPEPAKVILTMGKRDVSHDVDLPIPLRWFRPGSGTGPLSIPPEHLVTGLNDQHTHMTVPADSPLQVGDMVAFGISHPCTTFDKWEILYVVDDRYDVVDVLKTYF